MQLGGVDHKASASQTLEHCFSLLPDTSRVRSIVVYDDIIEVQYDRDVHIVHNSSYCALEMCRGIGEPELWSQILVRHVLGYDTSEPLGVLIYRHIAKTCLEVD